MNDIGPLIQQEDVGPFQQPVQDFPSFLRSEIEADRLFMLASRNRPLRSWSATPPGYGPCRRLSSPEIGASNLMTSAPSSVNTLPQKGAEMKLPHSTTRTPGNAPSITYIRPHIEAAAGISGHR